MVYTALRDVMESMVGGATFNPKVIARRIYNVTHAHDELRQLDRMETDKDVQRFIVFDLSSEQAYRNILRQVKKGYLECIWCCLCIQNICRSLSLLIGTPEISAQYH